MVETTLKTLIERFRSRPDWQHADPAVRAEAVLRLPSSEREVLSAIAQGDPDARVRRAALKKVSDVAALSAIASGDAEPSVREEAEARLAHLAVHEPLPETATAAVAGLRTLASSGLAARTAPLPPLARRRSGRSRTRVRSPPSCARRRTAPRACWRSRASRTQRRC